MNNVYITLSITFLLLFYSFHIRSSESDMKIIRERIVEDLMQVPVDDEQISFLINSLTKEGYWPAINYDDLSSTGFENAKHTSYLVTLTRAWNKPDSQFYKNPQLKAPIESALTFWVKNDFICENWWHNQIGTPNNLVNLLLLIGDELPETLVDKTQSIIGRANLNASGARPSGDRIKIAEILARNLLFLKDGTQFAEVVKVIEGEIKFETGRGMQYDYSFHHRDDWVNNTLSYGLQFADVFALWADYLHDTKYEFSQEKINILVDYYLDGICKMMVYGKYPDLGAKNRSISRRGALQAIRTSTVEKLANVTDYRKNELLKIIESDKNCSIVTTLNQCHLKGDVVVKADNKKQIFKKGNRQIKNAQWVYHNNVGYFFQTPTTINLSNQIQEGSWRRINRQSDISDEKVVMEVFKLWIDHGINSKNATYEYTVMPAITNEEFERRIDNRDIQILSNTADIQSVKHRKLNMIQAVFYKPGLLNISHGNYVQCEDPCIIMLSFNGERLVKISVADPNRNLESINFSLPIKIERNQDDFISKWDDKNKQSNISIRLPSGVYQGSSVTVNL